MPKKGYKQSEEHKKKGAKARTGFHLTDEHKEKIRQSNLEIIKI